MIQKSLRILAAPQGGYWVFEHPHKIVQVFEKKKLACTLKEIEALVEQKGWIAAGYVAYEPKPGLPVLDFALYTPSQPLLESELLAKYPQRPWLTQPIPSLSFPEYALKIQTIKDFLALGHTYQVNFTFPWTTQLEACGEKTRASPQELQENWKDQWRGLFANLLSQAQVEYPAYIEGRELTLLSASPELFFDKKGNQLTCRPMKGTLNRSQDPQLLAQSPKDQAENLMIVDMIRNDLGRISQVGSVDTTRLFQVETYPTVHQMVSQVESLSVAPLSEIFEALFPCASITGAPKIRTMEIIKQLEGEPRGVYTGAIGWIAPKGQARFSVAIRTLEIPQESQIAQYWTGGGIVWDSQALKEYDEAQTKIRVLDSLLRPFDLLESLLWNGKELVLEDLHWKRLSQTLARLGEPPLNLEELKIKLGALTLQRGIQSKVRVRVSPKGVLFAEAQPLIPKPETLKVALALRAAPTEQLRYQIKNTDPTNYAPFLTEIKEADEVILYNTKGQLTEGTFSNLALLIDGIWFTPPLSCGLLGGTWRENWLQQGRLVEKVLTRHDYFTAQGVGLMNSVRGWMTAQRIDVKIS